MDHMSIYMKNKVLTDNLIDEQVYVGLYTSKGEVNKGKYERQPVTFHEAAEGQVANNVDVIFPIPSEAWGDITHIGLFDSEEEGEMLFKAPAEFVKFIDVSNQYKIPVDYMIVRLR